MNPILASLYKKLIVSCQALEHEPLHGSHYMAQMAVAVIEGGAAGIRANSPSDIRAIKEKTDLPVIGLYKKDYEDSDIYITPTIKEFTEIAEAGAEIIAFDATNRPRPNGQTLEAFIKEVKAAFPNVLLMADISTLEEGLLAAQLGVDMISTTMAGYTPYSRKCDGYDFDLLRALLPVSTVPVISEGRIHRPEDAAKCIELGAFAVVVGTAITRPQEITKGFASTVLAAAQID